MVQKLDSAVYWNRMTGVIACREESDFGSLFISGRFDFRLDEPAATRRHSIFSWGKSRSARTDGKRAHPVYRCPASSVSRHSKEAELCRPKIPLANTENPVLRGSVAASLLTRLEKKPRLILLGLTSHKLIDWAKHWRPGSVRAISDRRPFEIN